ncbi:MAG: MBL fold metallo-hydrolase [Desulfovibrionaceae bacterium]|nr:MBL fold metallo-hydrolase [Desulfovibrionaceae bacterium]MBF0514404.1 MBL fold metallo-hydrolase [Desulfovibrionaceae bacterium]
MQIETYPLGPLLTNSYLLAQGGAALAVDCGGDPGPMLARLSSKGLTLSHVVLTHLHCDHIYGAAALARATGAIVLAAEEDKPLLQTEVGGGGFMGLPLVAPFDFQDLPPGETDFLGLPCRVLATPGHTPGSRSLYFPQAGAVFCGDLLFARSVGRTDFPLGDHDALLRSVREQIFTLPPQTMVYSGHGPQTSVGEEREHNPFFVDY